MTHVHHELAEEFPHHKDKLHELKMSDAHYVKIANEYTEINHEIHLIESGHEPATDERAETLKKKRLMLKDQIAAMLEAK